jgi:chromosome segregation ATPase
VFLLGSFLLLPAQTMAQSTSNTRPTSEQSLEELVREVRQLRATLQRMNSTTYKGQVILERLKLQQEYVTRLSRDLADTSESLVEMRTQHTRYKELVSKMAEAVESGVKHPSELASLKGELEFVKDREQRLAAREAQLSRDLELERAKLNDLNDRLNAFELELAPNKP